MSGKSNPCRISSESGHEPKLRREFVSMMFAVTVGEVGLQAAPLWREGWNLQFLPAYSHLVLAIIVIATSWVGWSLSIAPGTQRDVNGVFTKEFLVLLLDVLLVILYFLLVRSFDSEKNHQNPCIASASTEARIIFMIFLFYSFWDIFTKDFSENSWQESWRRMWPTIVCCVLTLGIWQSVKNVDKPYWFTVDVALLALVLLFRALKDWVAAKKGALAYAIFLSVVGLGGFLWSVYSWPLLPWLTAV